MKLPAGPAPRPEIASLPAYSRAAGAATVKWRASSNESVLPPPPPVLAAIAAAGADAQLYPTVFGDGLADDIAARLGVDVTQVVVGGGSLALLQQALLAYTGPGREVVFAWRSYEAYPILVGMAGADAVPVPLGAGSIHDLEAMLGAITENTAAVIVCNPNNPTGTEVDARKLERFLSRVPPTVLVLLDEAYKEFAVGHLDSLRLLGVYPNLALLGTFSKAYGLAGLRAGYLVASTNIADTLRKSALPFGLNAVAEAAARAAWADAGHVHRLVELVTEGRKRLSAGLHERGLGTLPSGANFVWIPLPTGARELAECCLARGVSVRAFDGEGVRVTVGERAAEDAVLAAVDDFLRQDNATRPVGQ
ncbi:MULTISPECIES: aminotransferase class I/II-fold pyridoxal phosphate-dependent enzyme [unclassified Arthrobacter]|uniref:aminotransferase class I/II-fold pyridoxal phosphate-dependent enzyme n=1 Tax=unclassified Arthrobacter TaxID=235627 RepID=UPI00159DB192|nr:aminotransferase class I/II-fold pyridoxal phosphate-dependent enzyme [Arthrobacter sp. STN4]MCQ9165968.1 aminotransferase class I/II-fold pyridoxal phosphate-dependent enzyme [Arthrobacter sp. STN4]NVM99871.1 aminotransferase class I/II-fold pyridoxal phosphate-dependent enzyme [Arthrobacter sp. SDTb3-6]